jgi:hypothetical protein
MSSGFENEVIWLRDLLPLKIPNARIMSYGYNANTRNYEQYSVDTLEGHAKTLVTKLALKRKETSVSEEMEYNSNCLYSDIFRPKSVPLSS